MIWLPAFLNKSVAASDIQGHIKIIETMEIAITKWKGLSFSKLTIWNAFFLAKYPIIKKSKIKATGPIITNSWKASKNTWFVILPTFTAML